MGVTLCGQMHYITASDGCAALEVLEDLVITPTRPALAKSCDIGVSASSWGVGARAARHPGAAHKPGAR